MIKRQGRLLRASRVVGDMSLLVGVPTYSDGFAARVKHIPESLRDFLVSLIVSFCVLNQAQPSDD